MTSSVFRFKQFEVKQQGSPMKINTDGVLLGAMAKVPSPTRILDVGTGTGVIALMLAQRFPAAQIDAVEIDEDAYRCARYNFEASVFSDRLRVYHSAVEQFLPDGTYDLIVANPPFFVNALTNSDIRKSKARHTNMLFFQELLDRANRWLAIQGSIFVIWPLEIFQRVMEKGLPGDLKHTGQIGIHSFDDSDLFRVLSEFSRSNDDILRKSDFVIYKERGQYSTAYRRLLKPFFLNF